MEVACLQIASNDYERVQTHLFHGPELDCEDAAFLFCQPQFDNEVLTLALRELWLLEPEAFTSRSEFFLELADHTRAALIKRAHHLNASLIEVHSHPRQLDAEFSLSDLSGFADFVPHVRWRLNGRPYAAIVCTRTSFDSLVWLDSNVPAGFCSIVVDGANNRPTGRTFLRERQQNDK